MKATGEGVAPVFIVTLPEAADPKTDQAIARRIDKIQRRQTFNLRPWHDSGEQALQQAHVRQTLVARRQIGCGNIGENRPGRVFQGKDGNATSHHDTSLE